MAPLDAAFAALQLDLFLLFICTFADAPRARTNVPPPHPPIVLHLDGDM